MHNKITNLFRHNKRNNLFRVNRKTCHLKPDSTEKPISLKKRKIMSFCTHCRAQYQCSEIVIITVILTTSVYICLLLVGFFFSLSGQSIFVWYLNLLECCCFFKNSFKRISRLIYHKLKQTNKQTKTKTTHKQQQQQQIRKTQPTKQNTTNNAPPLPPKEKVGKRTDYLQRATAKLQINSLSQDTEFQSSPPPPPHPLLKKNHLRMISFSDYQFPHTESDFRSWLQEGFTAVSTADSFNQSSTVGGNGDGGGGGGESGGRRRWVGAGTWVVVVEVTLSRLATSMHTLKNHRHRENRCSSQIFAEIQPPLGIDSAGAVVSGKRMLSVRFFTSERRVPAGYLPELIMFFHSCKGYNQFWQVSLD